MSFVSAEPGTIRWRTLEWWGAAFAIFVQTGAVTSYGSLRRLLLLLSFVIIGALLMLCRDQLRHAVSRSLPLAVLLLLPFASVLWSISGSISLRRASALAASMALAYVLAIRFTPRQLATLVAAVLGPCMLLSLVYAAALPDIGWMPGDGGMRGAFIHKNILGWYASISIIASAAVMASGGAAAWRRGGVFLAASLLCLVASGSMTGLLSTAAALCLSTFYAVLKRLRGLARALFVLIVLQLLAVVAISTSELLAPTLEALGKDATLTGRSPLWGLVDREIAEHLMFGVGYQAFWTAANPDAWAIWSKIGWLAPHAHSGYRDTLLNFGLVGMAIFMVAIARALVQGATLLGGAPQDGWLWLNVTVGMFLVMNLTESLFLMQNDFLFVLFATALIMFGLRAPEVRRNPPPANRFWRDRRDFLPA
jgi:exopolysaccharide production protein ExoQ